MRFIGYPKDAGPESQARAAEHNLLEVATFG